MKRGISKSAILLAVSLLFSSSSAPARKPDEKIVFRDEFNQAANKPVGSTKWTAESGGSGWGNEELQYYADSIENAYHDGAGSLVIKAIKKDLPSSFKCWYGQCRYTSARLITKGKFDRKYGRFEARIKIPRGQGMWAAFWMLGNDIDRVGWAQCGEIDVLENIGREPSTAYGTVHGPGYSGANGISGSYVLSNNQLLAEDFHVYATEWTENKIEFYVDGKSFKTVTPKNLSPGEQWVFDHPFFMILNLAIGGPWGGVPDATTQFPGVMMIDYVRVYKR